MATSIASFTESSSPVTYTATQTATVSFSAGDKIVVGGIGSTGDRVIGVPTATGLTFSSVTESTGSGSTAEVEFFEADAAAGGTNVEISVTASGTSDPWCFGVWVITGNPGAVGNTSQTSTQVDGTDTSRSLVTAAGEIVLMIESDWLAANTPQTLTAGSGTSTLRTNRQVSGQYTSVFGDWVGTSAATASYGSTSYSGRRCATAAIVIGAATYTTDQDAFRWGNDDGSESAHGWAAAEDTNLSAPLGSKLLRLQVEATAGDPDALAFSLRYQKNGAGGYVDVPVGASSEPTPVIETGDATNSGDNNTTPTSPWPVSRPTAATGDLLLLLIGWDDSTNNTGVTVANGPNGEVWSQIGSVVSSASTEVRLTAYWVVATGSWGAGSISVTPAANEQWTATVIKVPAGEFDSVTPIGANATRASTGTAETSVLKPNLNAGASDGGGRLVWAGCVDADPLVTLSSGYTSVANVDRGNVALGVATRDTAVTDSESVTDGTWSIASDSWCSIAFIVRAPTITNEVYISASGNIAAGGEATTARLNAPAGKTTSDFVTGRRWDDENGTDTINLTPDDYTEVEWSLTTQAPAVGGDYFDFRVYAGGVALSTYTSTPRWTIDLDTDAAAGEAAATAAAQPAAVNVAPAAGQPSATATAYDATTSSTGGTKWADQTHDFPGTSIDGTFWPGSYGATPTVHDNVLDFTAANNTYSGRASQGFDLIGSSLSFQVPTLPSPGGFAGGSIKADAANTDIFELQVRPGVPAIRTKYYGENWGGAADSTNVAVTPQAGTYLRISESGGTVTTEYSFDGSSWTTLDTYTPSASALAAMADCKLELNHGPFPDSQTAGPTFAKINLLPEATSVNAGEAQATASAHQAAVLISPNAGQASSSAAAQQAAALVAPNAGEASATATAQQPSTSVGSGIGSAAATAAAHDAATWLYANASDAAATAAAYPAAIRVAPAAGEAQADATSYVASTRVAPGAATGEATATAHDASASTSVGTTAGQATSNAVAWLAAAAIAFGAITGSATAAAHDATVHVTNYAAAAEATSTAAAHDASVAVTAAAAEAASTATAHPAAAGVSPSPATAAAATTAHQAAVAITSVAGDAQATAAAHDATVATAVAVGEAPATAIAHNASVSAAVNAGQASATGSGHNAVADVGVPKWADITNDFEDGTEATDNFAVGGGTITYAGNRAPLDMGYGTVSLEHLNPDHDLTGSYVAFKVEPNPDYGYVEFQITRAAGGTLVGSAFKRADQSVLNIYYNGATRATPTWDATAMAWWRWREAAGTLYFETSPTGVTWTEQWSDATAGATFDLTTIEVIMAGGYAVGGNPGTTGVEYAYVSKFNLLPVGSDANAGNAETIATAYPATVSTTANPQAGEAQANATAHDASISTSTSGTAQTATATATAHDAAVSTSLGSQAGEAAATATAHNPSVAITVGAQTAEATATAEFEAGTSVSLDLVADNPIRLNAVAHNATISTAQIRNADAGQAQATATAHDATVETANPAVDADAGQAAATATAHNATAVAGQVRTADAGHAAATAAAHDAVAQVGARPARVNAAATVYVPSIAKTVIAPIVNAVATIPAPTLRATSTVAPSRINGLATVFVPGVSMRANAPYFEATTTFFMPTPAEAQFVLVQVWNGTSWQSGILNVWNGSEWKPGSLRVYLAGQWQPS